jgi:hypothetical protein
MKKIAVLVACAAMLAACTAFVAGCGGDDPATTTPGSGALVTYSRTGGVASVPEQLVVEADGTATVEAGIGTARHSFELDQNELDQLRAELEAADLGAFEPPPGPSACADCFSYEVVYNGTTVSYDDAHPPAAAVASVVAHLGQITADHYPPDAFDPPAAG